MSSKKIRDPNAPKRNKSAYLMYQDAMRDTFKLQNPGMVSCSIEQQVFCRLMFSLTCSTLFKTFGQLSKYTSAMWNEMQVEEKEAWNQRAEADKARYLHELSQYQPPQGEILLNVTEHKSNSFDMLNIYLIRQDMM